MNEKKYTQWEKIRSKGRNHYIWSGWVLVWGIGTGTGWAVYGGWRDGWGKLPMLLGLGLACFPLGGYFLGNWMWKRIETEYRQALAERKFIYCDRDE